MKNGEGIMKYEDGSEMKGVFDRDQIKTVIKF